MGWVSLTIRVICLWVGCGFSGRGSFCTSSQWAVRSGTARCSGILVGSFVADQYNSTLAPPLSTWLAAWLSPSPDQQSPPILFPPQPVWDDCDSSNIASVHLQWICRRFTFWVVMRWGWCLHYYWWGYLCACFAFIGSAWLGLCTFWRWTRRWGWTRLLLIAENITGVILGEVVDFFCPSILLSQHHINTWPFSSTAVDYLVGASPG